VVAEAAAMTAVLPMPAVLRVASVIGVAGRMTGGTVVGGMVLVRLVRHGAVVDRLSDVHVVFVVHGGLLLEKKGVRPNAD
jgi:hypothetical protein